MNKPFNHFLALVDSLKASARPPVKPWPRLYQLGATHVRTLPEAERESIYAEYREFWKGHEGHSNRTEQSEFQADKNDERNSDWTR